MKIIKILVSSFIVFAIITPIFGKFLYVNADNEFIYNLNLLSPYINALESFNEKNNTTYAFLNQDLINQNNVDTNEMIEFFTKLTIDEFEEYVYKLHTNSITSSDFKVISDNDKINVDLSEVSRASSTQYVYYGKDFCNYLYVNHNIEYVYNKYMYTSCNYTGYSIADCCYPAYELISDNWQLNDDRTANTVTFTCRKYIAKYLYNLTNVNLKFTFVPYGGNFYILTIIEV